MRGVLTVEPHMQDGAIGSEVARQRVYFEVRERLFGVLEVGDTPK